jgi:hypothetical protein
MISGFEFSNISKWSCCNKYPIRFKSSAISEDDLIYLDLEDLQRFIETLQTYPPANKFVLISYNTNLTFKLEHSDKLKPYVSRIYATNLDFIDDPYVLPIPLGFIDSSKITHAWYKEVYEKRYAKDMLLYLNFSINVNKIKRTRCMVAFRDKPWVSNKYNISRGQYYIDISKSKYAISPEGVSLDSHRIYECMYLDTVPIVKTSKFDYFYENLPIVIVQDWNDVTEQFLLDNYNKCMTRLKEWKAENPTWTDAKYWIK